MHIDVRIHRTVDLDRLSSVSLLGVQFTPIHRLNLHHVFTLWVASSLRVIRRRNNGLSRRIEAKVCLIHELLVETRIDRGVVVGYGLIGRRSSVRIDLLCPVLEQFVQDALLLLVVNVHALALNGTAMRSKVPNGYQHFLQYLMEE